MRDIKFRGFDPVNKEMRFADIYETDEMSEWITWEEPEDSPQNRGLHFEIMQFTGLQDKNGVDIYEGDIVKSSGNNSLYFISFGLHSLTGFYFDEEGEEVSCTGFFCSRQGSYPDDIESLCNKSNIYLEVIGNIHQNPELLETK